VQYSDHDHRLVLVVDNIPAARQVAERWDHEGAAREDGNVEAP
jgi:hypothetical protein